mgnify:CR=1 FL=1
MRKIKFWQMFRPEIEEFGADISIWLNSDENVDAIAEEMRSDDSVFLMGEEVGQYHRSGLWLL